MGKISTILIFLFSSCILFGQTPGVSTYYEQTPGDNRQYIEYIPGNLPIILSAPHGGVKQSGSTIGEVFYPDNDSSLPDRTCGTNERDDNTDILVREIQKEIFNLTGCYAHVIMSNLHRSKLDPNREANEATCGDSDALDHWNAYHGFVDQASATIEAEWGKGIFLDIHGQSHSIPRIEVGYNVTAGELNSGNLNATNIINKSTIKSLIFNNRSNLTHEQLVRGDKSLGQLFKDAPGIFYASLNYPGCSHNGTNGYRAVPSNTDTGGESCDDTRPFSNPYFDGDFYNNRRHGSGNGANSGSGSTIGGGGSVDGIMTEVNRRVRDLGTYDGRVFDSRQPTLVPFAVDYAGVIINYLNEHYNTFANYAYSSTTFNLSDNNPTPTVSGLPGIFSGSVGLDINPNTGEINLSNTGVGSYTVTYTVGECDFYKNDQVIQIIDDTPDTQAPSDPTDLNSSNINPTSVDLNWTMSTDNIAVTEYEIFQDNSLIGTSSNTSYNVTGLTPVTTYVYEIKAKDAAGNISGSSNQLTVVTSEVVVNYCNSASTNVNDEYIGNVTLESIDNDSGAQFYSDFTGISTQLTKGNSYSISITPTWTGTVYDEGYAVWIDYNKNGDFTDAGELVYSKTASKASPVGGSFTVPNSAVENTTRMRVSMKYNAIPTSCETFTWGEVEDYTIELISTPTDNTPPTLALNGAATIDLTVGDTYNELGATATDNVDGDISANVVITGTVNTNSAGTYTLNYNVSDAAGNTATQVTRTVNVSTAPDTTPPTLTLNGAATIDLTVGDTYNELGATATDNVDGDISANVVITGTVNTNSAGTYTLNYNVSDAAGNAAPQVTRTVNVSAAPDTTPPTLALNGATTIDLTVGDTYNELGATATDNVDGDISANVVITGTVNTTSAGTYTLNYNVSDAAGNAAPQVTRTVNVSPAPDTTPPTLALNGAATIDLTVGDTYNELGATATDNVDGDISANVVITGTVNTTSAGTYTLNYNVSDAAGNPATQVTRTVNVSPAPDTTPPTLTLNGAATLDLTVGDTYNELGATATDNVDGDISINVVITGTVNTTSAGTYTLNYNVSDAAGNPATQVTRTVNVSPAPDTTPPTLTLNGAATLDLTVGDTYNELGATATDNVDGDISANVVITGTVNTTSAGTYTLNYNVSDAAGNAAPQVTRTVNVSPAPDTTPPTLTLNGAATLDLTVGDTYNEFGATATDNVDGNISANVIITGTVNTNSTGTYTLNYNVSDAAGNTAPQVTRTVNVSAAPDTTPPTLTLNGAATLDLTVGDTYNELGATATDNVDGDISANVVITGTVNTTSTGTYTLNYNVSDAAGNAAPQVTRTVNVSPAPDTTPPTLALNGAATIDLTVGDNYNELGATATDDIDGDISANVVITGTVNTTSAGTYTLNYNVSDAAGNTATQVTRTVNVSTAPDTTPPTLTLNGAATLDLSVGDTYNELGATATDNVDGDISPNVVITGTVNTTSAGTYTLNYDVSDAAGNTATQVTRTVNVSTAPDTTPPTLTLIGSATENLLVGDTYTERGATAIDNVDGDISANIVIAGTVNTSVVGTSFVTYNVSDAAGNAAQELVRTINITQPVDNTPPVISLIGSSSLSIPLGATYNDAGATALDNIDGDITANIVVINSVNTSTPGTYNVTYDVSDQAGNAAIQLTRAVTVINNNSCVAQVSSYPYSQSFESNIGDWIQSTNDDLNWLRDANGTPSNNTGPAAANDGSFYIFVEASGNNVGYPNKQAIITSPCFDLSGEENPIFSFDYHMFGSSNMGDILLEVSDDNGDSWTSLWNNTGNQGNSWYNIDITLNQFIDKNIQLRFNRTTGATWQADIALDNISLTTGSDNGSGNDICANGPSLPYSMSYETNLGEWTQNQNDDLNWLRDANGTPSSGTGPSGAADGSWYLYVEASGNGTGYPNKQAIINSPCLDLVGATSASLSFSYHMYGANDMGSIAVEVSTDGGTVWTPVWTETGDQGNQWLSQTIDLASFLNENLIVRFNRVTGGTWKADIAIDNISVTSTNLNNEIITQRWNSSVDQEPKLTVYPNPVVNDILNLNLVNAEGLTYSVYNKKGQLVLNGSFSNNIDIASLIPDLYIIMVNTNDKHFTKRFIRK